jgi:hypothetical protein
MMKIEKSKIVFVSILVVIVIFLITYTIMITGDDQEHEYLEETEVPELEENDQKVYESKLDAINNLKEVREKNIPSIYDDQLIDSLGYYDQELPEKEKERLIDSIYTLGQSRQEQISVASKPMEIQEPLKEKALVTSETPTNQKIEAKEMGLEHQLFFASAPQKNEISNTNGTESAFTVVVEGTQVVKANSRLRMRLLDTIVISGKSIPKNTPIFGFISFQPNRVLIEIENIMHHPTKLKAFDLQDGSEGIYVENNFRAEATTEVLDDLISDINIPSVPQVSGIGKVLRRSNRNVKVTVLGN